MITNTSHGTPLRCPKCGLEAAHSRDEQAEALLRDKWRRTAQSAEELIGKPKWWQVRRKRGLKKVREAAQAAGELSYYCCSGCGFRFPEFEEVSWSSVATTHGDEKALEQFASRLETWLNEVATDDQTDQLVHPETGEVIRSVALISELE
jgi:hypothetical protein